MPDARLTHTARRALLGAAAQQDAGPRRTPGRRAAAILRLAVMLAPILPASLPASLAAQTPTMPPGRPITTNDVIGGGVYMQFADARENRDGSREKTQHIQFPPMGFPPVIVLSVTQIDVATTNGRIAYHVSSSEPACSAPGGPDMHCTGFDLTVTAKPGTDIKEINVTWMALNVLNPALFASPTATLTPKP